jgi:predicted P-loop ATPase
MVARAYQPGCKMDNMPVLEGASGLSKTSLLEALGDEWYKPLPMEFGSKDFLQALRGAWLVEIPDMTGFGKVAHSAILATLTIRNDTYRAPYGREPQEYARTCVFAATSETDDYLADTRGKRRYWPLRCTDINLDGLRLSRADLFAEAISRYRNGARWYEMPDSTGDEQLARASDEPWQQPILQTARRWWEVAVQRGDGFREITAKNLLSQSMNLEVGKLTPADCRRVASILRGGGWNKKSDKEGAYWVWRERNSSNGTLFERDTLL